MTAAAGFVTLVSPFVFQRQNDNQSTFRNFWKKVRTLAPFLWPKKDCLLQSKVIFCFLLLAAGRVVNLYVPIYNKMIGKLFRTGNAV